MSGCPICQRVNMEYNPEREHDLDDIVFRNNKLTILKIEDTIYAIIPRSHMTVTELLANRALMGAVGKAMLDVVTRTTSVGMLATFHWNASIGNKHAIVEVEVTKKRD